MERVWERSFVAVSVLLGASVDDATAALPEGAESRPAVAELTQKLRDPRRAVRAQGLFIPQPEFLAALRPHPRTR